MIRFALILVAATAMAQQQPMGCHDEAPPVGWVPRELLERPIPIREGIGTVAEKVTTDSAEAQAFYNQGLAYLHSYVWVEAARSFHQALRHDPSLAMAYLGLSRAYSGISGQDAIRDMASKAASLASKATDREKTRIELRRLQLDAIKDKSLIADYRRALDQGLLNHFDDLELWLLRGNVEDRFGASGIGQYGTAASIPFYEHVLANNPGHFGADHYLIHSYEMAGRIDQALEHGAKFAAAAWAVPHAHHMYGHDLRRVGRIREAIERFEIADKLELEYFEREKIKPQIDWHHPHNIDLLATSYQQQGQMKRAESLMRRSFAIPPVGENRAMNKKELPGFLLSRHRYDEATAAAAEMTNLSFAGARVMGHLFAGQVALARGDERAARKSLKKAETEKVEIESTRFNLQPYFDKLRGSLLLHAGQREKGRELLKKVQADLRALPGPDAWMQALFELEAIADIARDAQDWELVEHTGLQMMAHDPAYGGSHYVLALVAKQKGAAEDAARHMSEAERLWSHADSDLPELQSPVLTGETNQGGSAESSTKR